jgi:hypothetical protein
VLTLGLECVKVDFASEINCYLGICIMTPDAIREFVGHAFVDVYVEKLDSGCSFWLEKKQVAPYSTRLIRVRKV